MRTSGPADVKASSNCNDSARTLASPEKERELRYPVFQQSIMYIYQQRRPQYMSYCIIVLYKLYLEVVLLSNQLSPVA